MPRPMRKHPCETLVDIKTHRRKPHLLKNEWYKQLFFFPSMISVRMSNRKQTPSWAISRFLKHENKVRAHAQKPQNAEHHKTVSCIDLTKTYPSADTKNCKKLYRCGVYISITASFLLPPSLSHRVFFCFVPDVLPTLFGCSQPQSHHMLWIPLIPSFNNEDPFLAVVISFRKSLLSLLLILLRPVPACYAPLLSKRPVEHGGAKQTKKSS